LALLDPPLIGARGGVHDNEFGRNAACFGQKQLALALAKMPVEVTREDELERAVWEGQIESVSEDEGRLGHPLPCDRQHPLALIESGHVPTQVAG
jgi:hypothetical protein